MRQPSCPATTTDGRAAEGRRRDEGARRPRRRARSARGRPDDGGAEGRPGRDPPRGRGSAGAGGGRGAARGVRCGGGGRPEPPRSGRRLRAAAGGPSRDRPNVRPTARRKARRPSPTRHHERGRPIDAGDPRHRDALTGGMADPRRPVVPGRGRGTPARDPEGAARAAGGGGGSLGDGSSRAPASTGVRARVRKGAPAARSAAAGRRREGRRMLRRASWCGETAAGGAGRGPGRRTSPPDAGRAGGGAQARAHVGPHRGGATSGRRAVARTRATCRRTGGGRAVAATGPRGAVARGRGREGPLDGAGEVWKVSALAVDESTAWVAYHAQDPDSAIYRITIRARAPRGGGRDDAAGGTTPGRTERGGVGRGDARRGPAAAPWSPCMAQRRRHCRRGRRS